MPAEIKFSLATKDWDEAVLRCQEENLKLERQWRAGGLIGTPPTELSHLQITALAGEFYAETVATHRDEPGPTAVWENSIRAVADVRSCRILTSQAWLGVQPVVMGVEKRWAVRTTRNRTLSLPWVTLRPL